MDQKMKEAVPTLDVGNIHAIAAATQVLRVEAGHTREIMQRIEGQLTAAMSAQAAQIEHISERLERAERRQRNMMMVMALVSGGISAAAFGLSGVLRLATAAM